jgi:RNA polymerase sigma-70 factor (ECF subfamily)
MVIATFLAETLWASAPDEEATPLFRAAGRITRQSAERLTAAANVPDRVLLDELRSGDDRAARDAFATLFRRHTPIMFAAAMRGPCADARAAAEDAVQAVMWRLWERRTELPEINDVRAYLIRATSRECSDVRRAAAREAARHTVADEDRETRDVTATDEWIAENELRVALLQAVAALPGRMGELFRAWWQGGATYDEIAKRFGVSAKAVDQARLRAIARLRADPGLARFLAREDRPPDR